MRTPRDWQTSWSHLERSPGNKISTVFGHQRHRLRWPNTVFARALANAIQRAQGFQKTNMASI